MKICIAQIKPFKGHIDKNIRKHKKLIRMAASNGADLIVFPELSLTGYEPKLAKELAMHQDDKRLDVFQTISNINQITIGAGIPLKIHEGIQISMIIFQPSEGRQTYSKQHLHSDEIPYFVKGEHQVFLTIKNKKVAPAICYEALLPVHVENAVKIGAEIYIASVAKSAKGVEKAVNYFSEIARKYSILVLMANCTGFCDDFESAGKSAIWNKKGNLLVQLNETGEGILLVDTGTEETLVLS